MTKKIVVACILAGCATIADAALWNFSYSAGAGTVSGQIDGTLQGDANTIHVASLSGLQFNSAPAPALPVIFSVTAYFSAGSSPPALSLDGSVVDFIACTTMICNEGFLFSPAGMFSSVPIFNSSSSYGTAYETFDANRWSITPALPGGIPEPSSWAMLIAGFGLVGAVARRRRLAVAA